jgi:hypothetical protein
MKVMEIMGEDKKSDVLNIKSILSNIFAYTDHKDLLEFSTVCKKWNNLINPTIHKTIALVRNRDLVWRNSISYDRTNEVYANADVVECVFNNAKYAPLVKEFKYDYKLESQRALEAFETFRFICILNIEDCGMSQSQFLGMISPLTQLQELNLSCLKIENILSEELYKESIQLPSTLKKLKLYYIRLIDNPELFIQTINSHTNLEKFSTNSNSNNDFLEPFINNYSSLLSFKFNNIELESSQSLFTIFEHNPQLISLDLGLKFLNNEIVKQISNCLINLEELELYSYGEGDMGSLPRFSQFAKIKKLNLKWYSLSNCSLNSILLSCPQLEELDLNPYTHNKKPNSVKFLNFSNPTKLRKLAINYTTLSEGAFECILSNCSQLNELEIVLSSKWKEAMKLICENCSKLEKLEICPQYEMEEEQGESFFKNFYESKFFTTNHKTKFTLISLTFYNFEFNNTKIEYFNSFIKLNSINYPSQPNIYNEFGKKNQINKGLFPGYRLLLTDCGYCYNVELKRNLIN